MPDVRLAFDRVSKEPFTARYGPFVARECPGLDRHQPAEQLGEDRNGPYPQRIIRRPSCLGMLISLLGWGLAFRSAVGVLLAALLVPPLMARIRAEERPVNTEFRGAAVAVTSGALAATPVLRDPQQFWLEPSAPTVRKSKWIFDVFWTVRPAGERLASVLPIGRCLECR